MSKTDLDPKLEPKEKTQPAAPMVDATGLAELIAVAVAAAMKGSAEISQESTKALVAALLQGPQPDPKDEANQRAIRDSDEAAEAKRKRAVAASQRLCPHLTGSHPLSEYPGQTTSIVKHRLDTGEIIGICTNCARVWRAVDSDYAEWMNKKSGNKMSEAGQRYINHY